jgi:hypothetical protein
MVLLLYAVATSTLQEHCFAVSTMMAHWSRRFCWLLRSYTLVFFGWIIAETSYKLIKQGKSKMPTMIVSLQALLVVFSTIHQPLLCSLASVGQEIWFFFIRQIN